MHFRLKDKNSVIKLVWLQILETSMQERRRELLVEAG